MKLSLNQICKISGLIVVCMVLITACSETSFDSVQTKDHPELQPEMQARPDIGFQVVIVSQNPGAVRAGSAGAPVVDNLTDAMDRVASGGTIRVMSGNYSGGIMISKPVTIIGIGDDLPIIDGTDTCWNFVIDETFEGPVRISKLHFAGIPFCGSLTIGPVHDLVVLEESVIDTTGISISPIDPANPPTGIVTIRNNSFSGKSSHIGGNNAGEVHILDNTFTGIGSWIHLNSTDAHIEGNELSGCFEPGNIPFACIAVGNELLDSGQVPTTEIKNNEIIVDISEQIPSGMLVNVGNHLIENNTITGVGKNLSAATEREQYPFTLAAFELVDGAAVTVNNNRVSNAFVGLQFANDVTGTGLNNQVDDVQIGIEIWDNSKVTVHSSDVTNYVTSLSVGNPDPSQTDLTCNWWGTAAGPSNVHAPDPSVFTPWATESVAGKSVTTCSDSL